MIILCPSLSFNKTILGEIHVYSNRNELYKSEKELYNTFTFTGYNFALLNK
jgi:hypothetical protein